MIRCHMELALNSSAWVNSGWKGKFNNAVAQIVRRCGIKARTSDATMGLYPKALMNIKALFFVYTFLCCGLFQASLLVLVFNNNPNNSPWKRFLEASSF